MEIGIIVGIFTVLLGAVGLYFRLKQEDREKERHAIEVAKEKDRQKEKQKQEEEKKQQIKLDEQKYRDGIREWEREGRKLAGSVNLAFQEIAERYEKELENLRGDFRSRGMFNSGFRSEAEDVLFHKRKKAEADFLVEKNEKEIALKEKRLKLDREYERIKEEGKKYGLD